MSAEISRREFEEYKGAAERAVKRLSSMKTEMKVSLGFIKQTMEVGLASFGMAWALARWGGAGKTITVVGVPVELGAALILKGVAFTGLLDEYSADAHNLGDGLLGVYLVKKGFELGTPTTSAGSLAVGALPAGNPLAQQMADAELARAMAALRTFYAPGGAERLGFGGLVNRSNRRKKTWATKNFWLLPPARTL